jgi:hypothetical protein
VELVKGTDFEMHPQLGFREGWTDDCTDMLVKNGSKSIACYSSVVSNQGMLRLSNLKSSM